MKFFNARRSIRDVAILSGGLALTALLTGCAGTVSGTSAAAEIDVRTLAVGNYPTLPLDVRAAYRHEVSAGKQLAVARLGDAVISGQDVDPKFVYTILSAADYTYAIANAAKPALDRNHLLFAYATSVSDRPRLETLHIDVSGNSSPLGGWENDLDATSFNVAVLQFPDEQQARTAADEIEAADFAVAPDQNAHVTLDKYATAKAHWRPGIPSMAATIAHGQYVVNVFARTTKPELDGLKSLATRILDAQLPLLDRTPPLSKRDSLYLDYDPSAMLRRTLHPGPFPSPNANEVTRTPRGYLHTVENQGPWKQLLDDNKVDLTATTQQGALLFRTPDAKSATALWNGINALIPGSVEAPPGVRDVTCVENPKRNTADFSLSWNNSDRYLCTLHYDRYVARVASAQLVDAQQRAAAQYALLANAQYL
ncbi:DUF7373 family lipoprotein [Nocardia concava]|uniref:DUF7373 family lipoprotein n=1 Tax=Nocardia concava TaxID=257281 RepID=UPI000302DB24|nr:hypothetical protein [Nocardia concava]